MKIDDQVCSLEISRRLKELGVKQDSVFWWTLDHKADWEAVHMHSASELSISNGHVLSAFNVAELGEMLPWSIDETDLGRKVGGRRWNLLIRHPRNSADGWAVAYYINSSEHSLHDEWGDKEADARGKMLIWLIENGFEIVCTQKEMDDRGKLLRQLLESGTYVPYKFVPTPTVNSGDSDTIDHPSYYTEGGIETIDFIEAKQLGYHLGNAVKYLSRAGKKDPETKLEDCRKAIWFIQRHIENDGGD